MFLNDDDFDEPDVDVPISRFAQVRRSAAPSGVRGGGLSMSNSKDQELDDNDDDDDDDDDLGGSGSVSQSSSRARMLAQQREILMKKRQEALEGGGMIRSSVDASSNSPLRRSSEHQFTPAVRQFSAPKSVKDASADASDAGSEFARSSRMPPVIARREEEPPKKPVRKERDYDAKPTSRRSANDDDDDEGIYDRGAARRSQDKPKKLSSSRYDDDEEDDRVRGAGAVAGGRRGPGYDSTYRDEDEKPRRRKDEEQDDWGSKPTSRTPERPATTAKPVTRPLDLSDMRSFLTSPLPKDAGVVQCYIRRNKNGTNKLFPVYTLYLKDGDRFLMCSKKRPNNKTSNYLVSMGENDLNRTSSNYIGKLRSNFMGTEFQVFDDGFNPKEERGGAGSHVRCELAGIMYQANVLGNRGPRKMQVAIPSVDESGRMAVSPSGSEDIVNRIKERSLRDLSYLINKPPRWNEQVNAYVLNFNGRVTMASVKNFQLVDPDEHNIIVLQFGRVGKDEFTMDMHYPISPLQAFAITLSSFDSKIACD